MIFIKTNWFIPKRFEAYNYGFITLMRPEVYHDEPLREHERTHFRQFLRSPLTHSFKYTFNKEYRFQAEAEAFSEQLKYYKVGKYKTAKARFAKFLHANYGLDKTLSQCSNAIKDLR